MIEGVKHKEDRAIDSDVATAGAEVAPEQVGQIRGQRRNSHSVVPWKHRLVATCPGLAPRCEGFFCLRGER
jgi:hypothetical protein